MTHLVHQSAIVCTSKTCPDRPVQWTVIYETDTNTFKRYDGKQWVDLVR